MAVIRGMGMLVRLMGAIWRLGRIVRILGIILMVRKILIQGIIVFIIDQRVQITHFPAITVLETAAAQ